MASANTARASPRTCGAAHSRAPILPTEPSAHRPARQSGAARKNMSGNASSHAVASALAANGACPGQVWRMKKKNIAKQGVARNAGIPMLGLLSARLEKLKMAPNWAWIREGDATKMDLLKALRLKIERRALFARLAP